MNTKKLPVISVFLFLALFFSTKTLAQQTYNIVPPPPEAASVFKFTEVPVSLYTGLPNINIPLLEIESGGVTIPISISYHARGIQLAEISSRVGLGWSLNCGGIISRQMRGNYDGTTNTADFNDFFTSYLKRLSVYEAYSMIDLDFIPDQYYFHINGQSGKFFFDYADGQPVVQGFSNIKITKTTDGFEIIDGTGNKYIFGGYTDYDMALKSRALMEFGGYMENIPDNDQAINSWHLNKIITRTGKEIEFSYEMETSRYTRRSCDNFEEVPLIVSSTIPPNQDMPFNPEHHNFNFFDPNKPFGPGNLYPMEQAMHKSYSTDMESFQNRITQITFDGGKVVFEYYSTNREDMKSGGNALKSITLYNKQNEQVKKALLDHFYSNSSTIDIVSGSSANMHPYYKGLDNANKRLFLNSVRFVDNQGAALPPYTFEYNNTVLPSRHSNSQDIWGYYNGKNNGIFLKSDDSVIDKRAVDTLKSSAGMLERIIYPEGGSANFFYEHNRVFSHFPKSVVFLSPNPIENGSVLLSNIDASFNDTLVNPPVSIYSATANKYIKTFIIPESIVGANMEYQVHFGNPEGCAYPYNIDCEYSVTILGMDNNVNLGLYITPQNEFRKIVSLPPGTYKLIVKPKSSNHNPYSDTFIIGLRWQQEIILPNEPMYAGGKRIKKIEYRDALNNLGLSKTYDYNYPLIGKSSGILFGLPNFLSLHPDNDTLNGSVNIFYPFGNIPGTPLSTYQENSLGYGFVTEYIGEGTNTVGKSVYTYTMTPDTGLYYEYPYHPPVDNEWLRGKEESVTHYKKEGDGLYTPVKKTENKYFYGDYDSPVVFNPKSYRRTIEGDTIQSSPDIQFIQPADYDNSEELPYLKTKRMFRIPFALFYRKVPGNVFDPWLYKAYYMTGGTLDLRKTKVTDYFDGGNEIVTETEYTYNYDEHYSPSSVKQTTSDGTTVKTEYKYPMELLSMPHSQDMVDKNMVDIPLVTKNHRGTSKLSEITTEYECWANCNDNDPQKRLLAPKVVKTSKGTNTLESRIQYIKYDDKGNPLELKQENGIHIVYLWGYNDTYPVAKLENIQYDQIPANLIADIKTETNKTVNYSESAVLGVLNALRTNLPNAMITTYTYKPLVGVASITDPRGNKTTYHYDNFERLQFIKDHNDNIIQETKYNYQN